MIIFLPGPHGEKLSKEEQGTIKNLLHPSSLSWQINAYYNTYNHFYSHNNYETDTFLQELQYIIKSSIHQMQVCGGIHTDTYGHTTGLIGQYNEYGEYVPSVVRDTYIRFRIYMDSKHFKLLHALNTESVFHFLIKTPHIERLGTYKRFPVIMFPVDSSLLPSAKYKHLNITFIT